MQQETSADIIRAFARREFIEPARRRGDSQVQISAYDVHKRLHLRNRVPNVCQALSGRKFLEENDLELEHLSGPRSGLGATVKFTYRIAGLKASAAAAGSPLAGLRGIAKEVFQKLGGGEAFIRAEREGFYGVGGDH
jgi:hypothetical protein